MSKIGTLYGVGVGPGDPELITVKAFRLLKESPVIAYPRKKIGRQELRPDHCRNVCRHPGKGDARPDLPDDER